MANLKLDLKELNVIKVCVEGINLKGIDAPTVGSLLTKVYAAIAAENGAEEKPKKELLLEKK